MTSTGLDKKKRFGNFKLSKALMTVICDDDESRKLVVL